MQSIQEPVELIWEQRADEPDHWFARFDAHARTLGFEYTLPRAFRLYTQANRLLATAESPMMWSGVAAEWKWAERAAAWADYDRFEQKRKWEQRREQIREGDFQSASSLRALVAKAIQVAPDFVTARREVVTDPKTGHTTITVFKELKMGDVIKAFETAAKIARLAAEMDTDRSTIDVNATVQIAVKGYVGISPDDWDNQDQSGVQPLALAGEAVEGQIVNDTSDG